MDEDAPRRQAGSQEDLEVTITENVSVGDTVSEVHTLHEEYVAHDLLDEASGYPDERDTVSYIELIGAVLGRAQIVEEIMRMMIVRASDEYHLPRQIPSRWTFGMLVNEFTARYPDEEQLADLLKSAKDVRNSAAHDDLLVVMFIKELLADAEQSDISRFAIRGLTKSVKLMDWVLREMLHFLRSHPVEFDDWYGDREEPDQQPLPE